MTLKKAWPTTREAVSFTCRRHSFNLPRGTAGVKGARGGCRRGWDPPGWRDAAGHGRARGRSPAVAVAVADGVPAQVAAAVAGGEGVDDVLAVVMVPAAAVGVLVLPCREGTGYGQGCRQGWGAPHAWTGTRWGWDQGWTGTELG